MAIINNVRLVVKVCKLYYQDNMSQKEISSMLDISRPQICRMLNYAKEKGIVTIGIKNPYSNELSVEKELARQFGLKDAFVTDVSGAGAGEALAQFAAGCAAQLETYLPDNAVVGVMSGKTLAAVAQAVTHISRDNLEFVPLVGGVGTQGNDWNANAVARILAQKSSACYSVLNAPIRMQSEAARNLLVQEPAISSVLQKGEACTVALVGIGQISTHSTTYQSGAFGEQDLVGLRQAGAVASLSVCYLNAEGEMLDTSLTRSSIGWVPRKKRKNKVVAIATGSSKLAPVRAALAGGYVDVLMTTLEFAECLLHPHGETDQ